MNALILVDIQNDFCPGGALAVPEGDLIIETLNRLQPAFDVVVATQDWHPPGHGSFASTHGKDAGELHELDGLPQVMWPDHCTHGSEGAEFHPTLDTSRIEAIFRKGTDPTIDSYSGFFDNARRKRTGLAGFLQEKGVSHVYVAGLATDYCVKYTALDAASLGFTTYLIEDASRGVDLQPGDVTRAVSELKLEGVKIVSSQEVLDRLQTVKR